MHLRSDRYIFWSVSIALLLVFSYLFSSVCVPFLVGAVCAYLCAPLVDIISEKINNRSLVSAVFVICVISVFVLCGFKLFPRITDCLSDISKNAPEYYEKLINFFHKTFSQFNIDEYQSIMESAKSEIQKYLDQKLYIAASMAERLISTRGAVIKCCSFCIVMPISFFYFLRDWNDINKTVYNIIPNKHKKYCDDISLLVRNTLSKFIGGQFCVVMILSVFYTTFLCFMDVNQYISLGILSGFFSFIPFLGAIFSCIIAIFVNIPVLTLTKLYLICIVYFVGQFVEGYILTPNFISKRTGLHPLWIIFSFFAGIELFGVIGVLIAIPITAVMRSIVVFVLEKFISTNAYKQQ